MNKYIALLLLLTLSGCGVDVATSAATVAAAKAKEIKEGKKTEERMVNQVNAALVAGQQRNQTAEREAEQ
jgi:hypothetical protein